MNNKSKNVLDFYLHANSNKYKIAKYQKDTRDMSVAEETVLSCINAIARASEDEIVDWDNNKVIKYLLLESINEDEPYGFESFMADKFHDVIRNNELNYPITSDEIFTSKYLRLQQIIRQGHIYWGAYGNRLESILEHIYGCCMLAIGLDKEYPNKIDIDKLLKMLLLHETEEIAIGDLTEWDISKEEKDRLGNDAVKNIFSLLKDRDELISLLDEFNEGKTITSKYANLCDKLEYDLQVKVYENQCRYDFDNIPNNVVTTSDRVRRIIENGANSVFDVHYEYDKHRYESVPCMKRILEESKKI